MASLIWYQTGWGINIRFLTPPASMRTPIAIAGVGRVCPDKLVATNAASRLPVLCAKSNTIKAPTGNVSINEANAKGSVMFGTS